jgi:hypothetical protein
MTTTVGNCRMTKLLLPDPNYIQDQFCGIVSACWARCHEIESRQGIYWVVVFKKTKAILVRQILSYIQSSMIITFKAICDNTLQSSNQVLVICLTAMAIQSNCGKVLSRYICIPTYLAECTTALFLWPGSNPTIVSYIQRQRVCKIYNTYLE